LSPRLGQDFSQFVRGVFATDAKIPLHAPTFDDQTVHKVEEVINSTFVSSVGPEVAEFENQVCRFVNAPHAVATVNGTSALHLCLVLAGVESGDYVLTSPISFIATCNAIRYSGGTPLFIDVERSSLALDPIVLQQFIEEETEVRDDGLCWHIKSNRVIRACLPVHCLGHPARTEQIQKLCRARSIEVVEDAAAALGSFERGRHVGTSARASAISFNGNKIITTGGGGMVVLGDPDDAKYLRHLSTQAKLPHAWEFEHDTIGFNYRMPNLNAALGLGQFQSLPIIISKKYSLFLKYRDWFGNEGVEMVEGRVGTRPNYWLNAIVLPSKESRDHFLEQTNRCGVATRPLWKPMSSLKMFKDCIRTNLQVSEDLYERIVTLPSSPF